MCASGGVWGNTDDNGERYREARRGMRSVGWEWPSCCIGNLDESWPMHIGGHLR